MLRNIIAVVVGLMAAVITISLVEMAGHFLSPPPVGIDPSNTEKFKEIIQSLPLQAFLFVLAAWFMGTFSGASVALLISKTKPAVLPVLVTLGILLAAIGTLVAIPHPIWFVVASTIGIPVSGFLAWLMQR